MAKPEETKKPVIAFQGVLGAYSHLATSELFDDFDPLPSSSFDKALEALAGGAADLAVIPIENSTFGRVADIHLLLPKSGLFIIRESFLAIRHMLLAPKGASLESLKKVMSHPQALGQCRETLKKLGLEAEAHADTAGAALDVSKLNDPTIGALASSLAGKTYGLDTLQADMQDLNNNTTRFVVLSRSPGNVDDMKGKLITSLSFEVKHAPAALYKALGGFATNGINMIKLESYYDSDSFHAYAFYAEIEGHAMDPAVARALEELSFHSRHVRIHGTFELARTRGR